MRRLILIVAVLTLAWPAAGQSLGEIAKKNADAKAAAAKDGRTTPPAKTYTNADLEPVTTPALPVTVAAPAGVAHDPGPSTGEAEWRGRMRQLEDQISVDTTALDAARRRLATAQADTDRSRVDTMGRVFVDRDLRNRSLQAADEVSRLLATVAADKQILDRFLEDARKAGVPPGWLR